MGTTGLGCQIVGQHLRELRLAKGFSQEGVAGDLGISHATLSAWERGTRAMSLDSVFRLAGYFGVEPQELVQNGEGCSRSSFMEAREGSRRADVS